VFSSEISQKTTREDPRQPENNQTRPKTARPHVWLFSGFFLIQKSAEIRPQRARLSSEIFWSFSAKISADFWLSGSILGVFRRFGQTHFARILSLRAVFFLLCNKPDRPA
jgi:hypothetical protein